MQRIITDQIEGVVLANGCVDDAAKLDPPARARLLATRPGAGTDALRCKKSGSVRGRAAGEAKERGGRGDKGEGRGEARTTIIPHRPIGPATQKHLWRPHPPIYGRMIVCKYKKNRIISHYHGNHHIALVDTTKPSRYRIYPLSLPSPMPIPFILFCCALTVGEP